MTGRFKIGHISLLQPVIHCTRNNEVIETALYNVINYSVDGEKGTLTWIKAVFTFGISCFCPFSFVS